MWNRLQRGGHGWSWVRGARVAALTAAVGFIFLALLGGELEEVYGLGALFRVRGPVPAPPDVVIVAIDLASQERLKLRSQPWPRTVHADLIRVLKREGAKAIAFDLYFEQERAAE